MTRPPQADAVRRSPEIALEEAEEFLTLERLERISGFDGGDLPVVSMYLGVPAAPGDAHARAVTKADSLLHQIRPLEEDRTRDHAARMSLRGDIESIEAVVDAAVNIPETLAIISCSGADMLEVVRLPRAVRDRILVDATPWTRPMLAVLDEHRRCLAAVVDRESAHAWELYLGQIRDRGSLLTGREQRAARLEAVNGKRDANRAEELEKRYFREVANALDQLLEAEPDAVLVLGGHENELALVRELLARAAQQRLVGTFSVDHTTATAGAMREQVEAILDRYELDEQRRRVEEVIGVAAAGGHAAVGLEECLWAGSAAAVETLFVQEGVARPGVVCDRSRWLGLEGEQCPVCGDAMRPTPDVIDELGEAVLDEGGSVRTVRVETELGELLTACTLRFELPSRGGP
jgi:peptide subunit release factor 1 (eRF1)